MLQYIQDITMTWRQNEDSLCSKGIFYSKWQSALTRIQFDNLTLVVSALVPGGYFNISSISDALPLLL
jgi:hypothetical protein